MSTYDRLADRTFSVDATARTRHGRETSSDFTRATTVFELHGEGGVVGRGEDVTYDTEDHDALATVPDDGLDDALTGTWTFDGFSAALDDLDLFPTKPPERPSSRHYRRWALESAGLDLALKGADIGFAEALGRDRDPVAFVASARLGDPPTTDRVDSILARHPDLGLKLDPTSDWTDDVVDALADTGAVRVLDLKGHYAGTQVYGSADPALYDRVVEAFPDAVIEDPALTEATRPIVEAATDRLCWDAPITGVESVHDLPYRPRWLNVKPSRFGTVESLFETVEYASENDVVCYGGGQFELGVGRDHVQTLAATFYPDAPNDVAPGGYNLPDLPGSPLRPDPAARGLDF